MCPPQLLLLHQARLALRSSGAGRGLVWVYQGLVYLPYLHEWNARSHNLLELCAHMSSVFGAEPPVFASKKPQQQQVGWPRN